MDVILTFFVLLFALFAIVRVMRRARERRMRSSAFARAWSAHYQRHASTRTQIAWAEPTEILRLMSDSRELVIFRLIDNDKSRREPAVFRGEILVMLHEFEGTVPWIPMASRIVVCHGGGIDASLAGQIAARAHGREVLLLRRKLPTAVEQRLEMAGPLCS
jgi:hypothetical protein